MITNVKVYGLEESIKASKYPKATDLSKLDSSITKMTHNLASVPTGTGHDNFLKGISVHFDVNFTIKAWTEAERYHFFEIVSSQSTMHCIEKFDIKSRCCKYVSPVIIEEVERLKKVYLEDPTPENFLYLVYSVPVGFELTARISTNYQQLKTIYFQRRHHRLPEWQVFCDWIETLPYFNELVLNNVKCE